MKVFRITLLACCVLHAYAEDEPTSLMTSLFKSAAEGAFSEAGGEAMGWVLGAPLGLASSDSQSEQQLEDILGELQTIETTLTTIVTELSDIDGDLQDLLCIDSNSEVLDAISLTQTYFKYYQNLMAISTGSHNTTPAIPDITCKSSDGPDTCISDFANTVLDSTSGVLNQLKNLQTGLTGQATPSSGVIESCLKQTPPAKDMLEESYHSFVYKWMAYYYAIQTQAVLMLVEAYHFQAWEAAGKPKGNPSEQDYNKICTGATDSTVIGHCLSAQSTVTDARTSLVNQFKLAGTPISSSEVVAIYTTQPDTSTGTGATLSAFARSLEAFSHAHNDSCTYPLASVNPCGVTTSGDYSSFEYANVTGWKPSEMADLNLMLTNYTSGSTVSSVLANNGFENATGKIILAGTDTASVAFGGGCNHDYMPQISGNMYCFLDTEMDQQTTLCSDDALSSLVQTTGEENRKYGCSIGSPQGTCSVPEYTTSSTVPSKRGAFYNVSTTVQQSTQYCGGGTTFAPAEGTEYHQNSEFTTQPEWWVGSEKPTHFTWPVLHLPNEQFCTTGIGTFTLCGAVRDAYLDTIVPTVPALTNYTDFTEVETTMMKPWVLVGATLVVIVAAVAVWWVRWSKRRSYEELPNAPRS